MRLRRLHLERFGHFTDRVFDFGEASDAPDFHIIYGANEAGKTTSMEAVLRLFYGFPTREAYGFKHQRANLQVSGQVEIGGDLRHFTRLPKRAGDLVDEAGTALPEAALAAHLGGLGLEDYRKLFCLDDETIEKGGEEIANARGDIGRLLFSAAAGLPDLSAVLDGVRDEADGMWRKRSSTSRVAGLKRDWDEVRKAIRERDVTAGAWKGLKATLAQAQAAEVAAKAARADLLEAKAVAEAKARAVPRLAEMEALKARIAPYDDYPQRLDFDPEDLVTLISSEAALQADLRRLAQDLEALETERDGIDVAPELLALAEALADLEDLRARDRTNALDLDRRRNQRREAQAGMDRAAQDLGLGQGGAAQDFVLPLPRIAALQAAREEVQAAATRRAAEAREVEEIAEQRALAQAALEATGSGPSAGQVVGDLMARHDADRLASAVAQAQAAIDGAEAALREALAGLRFGAVTFERLPDCGAGAATAQEMAARHEAMVKRLAQETEALAQHEEDVAARRAQAEELVASGQVVPDAEAEALWAAREANWQAHLAAMEAETAQAFEGSMRAFDEAMRARVAQASDLGQMRQVSQALAEATARAGQCRGRRTELQAELAALERKVQAAAQAAGLGADVTPGQWLSWAQAFERARDAARALAEAERRHRGTLERGAALREALAPLLDLEAPDFEGALGVARLAAQAEREAAAAGQSARDALARSDTDLKRRQARLAEAQAAEAAAEAQWTAEVEAAFGTGVSPETLRASLEPVQRLRDHAEKQADAAQRIAAMEADRNLFARSVAELARAHDVPEGDSAAETFAQLQGRAEAARRAANRLPEIEARIDAAKGERSTALAKLAQIAAQAATWGAAFADMPPEPSLEALRKAAHLAEQVIADRQALAAQERAVLTDLGAGDIGQAHELLAGATVAALEAEGAGIAAELEAADGAVTTATEARVAAEVALAGVPSDGEIAGLVERKTTLELELAEAAEAHLQLSLGHQLATAAIRRYREAHRSGMMQATETCFSALTRGKYARLSARPEGGDEVLLAIDRDGTSKEVGDLSKGTRFQLYLALRAAAYEQLVANGTCLPFFCDDIFETFDEDRTSAACRVMEQIGRAGQAIYLTHHRHVVEIAKAVCDTPPRIHEI